MREMDINIEGYNVNGICVACLNYKRKMFYHSAVPKIFKILADIDVSVGIEIQVCWECLAAVAAVCRFRNQILKSYEFLSSYSKKHPFLNSPQDFAPHAVQRLSQTPVTADDEALSVLHEETEVKVEFDEGLPDWKEDRSGAEEDTGSLTEWKEDIPDTDIEEPDLEAKLKVQDYEVPLLPEVPEPASDDEVLSNIKRKKEKKERKQKKNKREKSKKKKEKSKSKELKDDNPTESSKNSRKLKNLPKDLVELYTMKEKEMWLVREADLASIDFQKMKYKCEDCILGFHTQKLMVDHRNGKHSKKTEASEQCDVCKAYLLTKDNLSVHRSLHRQALRCVECGHVTTLKQDMLQHVRIHVPGDAFPCDNCDKQFPTKSKLAYHKVICHQERPQCDCCGKVFANKMTLKYHLKVPQEKPKEKVLLNLKCKGCEKVFHTKKSYRAHVVIHDGLMYPCPICGKLFRWKRNLSRHTRNHREKEAGSLHECRECGKTFASRDCYNNHMRLSKRHVAQDALSHQCSYCGKKFATKWCMVDHVDWDHLKRIKYQCSVCFKAFKTAKIMVAHYNNIHEGKNKQEPEGEHLCEICGKSYKTVKRLKGHVWAMHTSRARSRRYKCALCPATFTWQTSIYKHAKIMHSGGKRPPPRNITAAVKKQEPYQELAPRVAYYTHQTAPPAPPAALYQPPAGINHREKEAGSLHECRECGKTFASRDCYNNHMRLSKRHVAQDALSHQCSYCGKKFATKWCMVDHVDWDHLKRIKYQCSVCFKAFKTAKIMVAHYNNIHEGKNKQEPEGEHLCEICGKSYKTVKRLKGHVWAMHTSRARSRRYKCALCPATFTWQTSIYKHAKIMHSQGKRPPPRNITAAVKKQEPYQELAPRVAYYTHQTAPPAPPSALYQPPAGM